MLVLVDIDVAETKIVTVYIPVNNTYLASVVHDTMNKLGVFPEYVYE